MYIPSFEDVKVAHERIRPHIHRTPVLTSTFINAMAGAELFFKCENFQKAAAFKVRGASNAVFGLDEETAKRGVATHSSGNHALSLSYAAGRRGIPCNVVMPRTAPQAKKDAVRGYGGVITECEPSTSSREATFAKDPGGDGGGLRPPLQRSPGDRGAGDLLAGAHRAGRGARCRHRADRRRRHDLGHLPHALECRAAGSRSTPPSPSRPTTPTAASRPAISSPTTRPSPSRTGSRCRSRSSPGISSVAT